MDVFVIVFFLIIPLILVAIIVPVSVTSHRRKKAVMAEENRQTEYALTSLGFALEGSVLHNGFALCVDNDKKLWCFKEPGPAAPAIYRFDDLNDFEINEDGFAVIKGGGLGVGVGIGPIGVGLGGGSRRTRGVATLMELRIRVNDVRRPEIVIKIFRRKIKKESITYRKHFEKAKEFAAMLTYIQHNAGQAAAPAPSAPSPAVGACPGCGMPLALGMRFCPRCGFDTMKEPVCRQCGAQLTAEAAFCTGCGARI
jgi:hypothetical protein